MASTQHVGDCPLVRRGASAFIPQNPVKLYSLVEHRRFQIESERSFLSIMEANVCQSDQKKKVSKSLEETFILSYLLSQNNDLVRQNNNLISQNNDLVSQNNDLYLKITT